MIKTNIKMRVTPEQSKKVQEICFHNGIYWSVGTQVNHLYMPFLFIGEIISFTYKAEEDYFLKNKKEEVDADLFIRTNGTCIEEKEFVYPMWFESKATGDIVKFSSLTDGMYVFINEKYNNRTMPTLNKKEKGFIEHTDTKFWEQVENPNEHLDRLDDIVDEAIKEVSKEDSHNAHYKTQKIDTIARCKANMTLDQQKAICIFNCDKYLHRSKGQDLEDIQKVRYYLNWLEDIEKQLKKDSEDYQEWQ